MKEDEMKQSYTYINTVLCGGFLIVGLHCFLFFFFHPFLVKKLSLTPSFVETNQDCRRGFNLPSLEFACCFSFH
jgi:hypothetical protein